MCIDTHHILSIIFFLILSMGAYEATKHLIAQGRKRIIHVTGDMNYTASLERFNGFVRAMRDSHIPITADSIPGETAVIGFDDDTPDSRDIIFPGLSTMRQPMYEMGCSAVELLLAVIRDPAHQPETRCFQPQLILRETCK